MEPIIRFDRVRFSYPAEPDAPGTQEAHTIRHPALDGLDLTVRQGEFIALIGRNGCGKSTLAKLCNGLLIPSEGSVTVRGLDTRNEPDLLKIRQTVGMVFQNPDNQIVATVVEEDVAFAPENLGVPPEEIRRRVDGALKTVGMSDYARHAPHRLSGGQKQRVSIAGVLAMRPDCIVLDEPTAMLDPQGRREVLDTVRALGRETGITILLITHHMEEACMADRVVVMSQGKVLLDDTPRRVFSEAALLEAHGLTAPQTVRLTRRSLLPPALDAAECAETLREWLLT